MDDRLCLELIMNNHKHKRKNKPQDDAIVSPFVKSLRKTFDALEPVILKSPTVLSNFDVFLQQLSSNVTRIVDEFDKDLHGKRD